MVERQFNNTRILVFLTNGGGEYFNGQLMNYLHKKGIKYCVTALYSHVSNGIPERLNRTTRTIVRVVLQNARLHTQTFNHQNVSGEAPSTAIYIKNRLPHTVLNCEDDTIGVTTLYEALLGHSPAILYLRPLGSLCLTHIAEERQRGDKLSPRAQKSIFIGYNANSNLIYRILRLD